MTPALVFDIGLCLLILGTALAAVAGRVIFAAIVFFITYGLLVAIAWVRLESVDVALAEAAIGAGLTGVLLLGAWSRLPRNDTESAAPATDPLPGPLARAGTGLLCAALAGLLAWAVLSLPDAAEGLLPEVAAAIDRTGVTNPVTAVLLAFRAYDTLLEVTVIAVALVAVWALTPEGLWRRPPGLRQHVRPDGVLATFGRLLPPAGLVVAVYLVWAGSTLPGGAFQAGTILAAVLLLTAMAGLHEPLPPSDPRIAGGIVAGPLVFLAIGAAGMAIGGFLTLPEPWSKPLIVTIELALIGSIALTLAFMVLGTARERAP